MYGYKRVLGVGACFLPKYIFPCILFLPRVAHNSKPVFMDTRDLSGASAGTAPDTELDSEATLCTICCENVYNLCSLGNCGHTMCPQCVNKLPVSSGVRMCPMCRVPVFWAMETVPGLCSKRLLRLDFALEQVPAYVRALRGVPLSLSAVVYKELLGLIWDLIGCAESRSQSTDIYCQFLDFFVEPLPCNVELVVLALRLEGDLFSKFVWVADGAPKPVAEICTSGTLMRLLDSCLHSSVDCSRVVAEVLPILRKVAKNPYGRSGGDCDDSYYDLYACVVEKYVGDLHIARTALEIMSVAGLASKTCIPRSRALKMWEVVAASKNSEALLVPVFDTRTDWSSVEREDLGPGDMDARKASQRTLVALLVKVLSAACGVPRDARVRALENLAKFVRCSTIRVDRLVDYLPLVCEQCSLLGNTGATCSAFNLVRRMLESPERSEVDLVKLAAWLADSVPPVYNVPDGYAIRMSQDWKPNKRFAKCVQRLWEALKGRDMDVDEKRAQMKRVVELVVPCLLDTFKPNLVQDVGTIQANLFLLKQFADSSLELNSEVLELVQGCSRMITFYVVALCDLKRTVQVVPCVELAMWLLETLCRFEYTRAVIPHDGIDAFELVIDGLGQGAVSLVIGSMVKIVNAVAVDVCVVPGNPRRAKVLAFLPKLWRTVSFLARLPVGEEEVPEPELSLPWVKTLVRTLACFEVPREALSEHVVLDELEPPVPLVCLPPAIVGILVDTPVTRVMAAFLCSDDVVREYARLLCIGGCFTEERNVRTSKRPMACFGAIWSGLLVAFRKFPCDQNLFWVVVKLLSCGSAVDIFGRGRVKVLEEALKCGDILCWVTNVLTTAQRQCKANLWRALDVLNCVHTEACTALGCSCGTAVLRGARTAVVPLLRHCAEDPDMLDACLRPFYCRAMWAMDPALVECMRLEDGRAVLELLKDLCTKPRSKERDLHASACLQLLHWLVVCGPRLPKSIVPSVIEEILNAIEKGVPAASVQGVPCLRALMGIIGASNGCSPCEPAPGVPEPEPESEPEPGPDPANGGPLKRVRVD